MHNRHSLGSVILVLAIAACGGESGSDHADGAAGQASGDAGGSGSGASAQSGASGDSGASASGGTGAQSGNSGHAGAGASGGAGAQSGTSGDAGSGALGGAGAALPSGGGAGLPDTPDPEVMCAEFGGSCVPIGDVDEPCPEGTYPPFSGASATCRSDPLERCCVPTGDVGSPCTDANPCANGGCQDEDSGYPTGGICTQGCGGDDSSCPEYSACVGVMWSQAPGVCLVRCASDGNCREGWSCQPHPIAGSYDTVGVCWQPGVWGLGLGEACSESHDCLSGVCWIESGAPGLCTVPCSSDAPCLSGFTCDLAPSCSSPDCRFCFPGDA